MHCYTSFYDCELQTGCCGVAGCSVLISSCCGGHWQAQYGDMQPVRSSMKAMLRNMVDAGRLERVPQQPSLYRIGGVVRRYAQDADHADVRPARNAKRRADPQVRLLPPGDHSCSNRHGWH